MKTLTQIKRSLYIMMVAITALLTSSCVVPKAGGGPVKNGTFALNMKINYPSVTDVRQTVFLYDGDMLSISLTSGLQDYWLAWDVNVEAYDKNKNYVPIEIIEANFGTHIGEVYPQGIIFNNSNTWTEFGSTIFHRYYEENKPNNDGYIVFRKKESGTNNYIYFWLKFKDTKGKIQSLDSVSAIITTGKYQVGSIKTGL